ncbi:MAG: phage tail protein, partial [Proteobacteria bacterium]|nr:phage tail protein [Pseudomonadota bacterium]
ASSSTPTGNVVGAPTKDTLFLQTGTSTDMAPESVAESGESKPHSNMQPYLAINFIISLYGEYPSRN